MFKTICFKVKKVAINFFIKSDYIRIKEGKIGIKTIDVCILPCNKCKHSKIGYSFKILSSQR